MAQNGTVKWFNATKGYGFVQPEDGGKDVFVHITALQASGIKNLPDGARVTFDLEENNGRVSAVNLQLLETV